MIAYAFYDDSRSVDIVTNPNLSQDCRLHNIKNDEHTNQAQKTPS